MWKSNDNLMYSNLIYMLTAYAFPIWISEIRSQQGIKKENERKRADSKQPMYAFSSVQFSSLQSLSRVQLFVTPWITAHQASLSITNSWSLSKLMSIESVMSSNHLSLCCPLSSRLQSFPTSGSFQMSQLLASGGRSIGVSASTSVLPMNTQDLSHESFITECLKCGQCDWDQNI